MIRPPFRLGSFLGHVWEQTLLPLSLHGSELLFSPANTGPLSTHRQVVTIHDLAWLDLSGYFRSAFSTTYRQLLPRLARQSVGVITISEHSKIRIQERLQISSRKIHVVPLGIDTRRYSNQHLRQTLKRMRQKYGLNGQYILYVGTLAPHKNLPLLLTAWQELNKTATHQSLIIAGVSGKVFVSNGLQGYSGDPAHSHIRYLGSCQRSRPGCSLLRGDYFYPAIVV